MNTQFSIKQLKNNLRSARHGITGYGAYPVFYMTAQGEVLCNDCILKNLKTIMRAMSGIRGTKDSSWQIVGVDVHYEGSPLECVECSHSISSAYGEVANG